MIPSTDALKITQFLAENPRSLKGSACLRYICPPLEADIVSPTAVKVFLFLIGTSATYASDARRENHSRQGIGFSPSHFIFLPPWRTSYV
ncbi:hypothetical protein KKI93_18675 [Xenorhabdus bovienii]|uniref:hypothetical protein n=1 Tax=Xenorhabdus bovienii TaxID=40576 RepID=UPI0012D2C6F9|nr:hypothetical protein [Xenorhabdus bovienii]MDE9544468.1 hypothetical protein [Xenorhabdus bovienii]MDE9553026.1 hypothetical protein [Xenorhabdus bovienii]MDE9566026.1 hypothetical protein [Xenorhabdus bovienii]